MSSETAATSPCAIAVYVETHASTCQAGAPYWAREAYASSNVSGWYEIGRPSPSVRTAAISSKDSDSGPVSVLGDPVCRFGRRHHEHERYPGERGAYGIPLRERCAYGYGARQFGGA